MRPRLISLSAEKARGCGVQVHKTSSKMDTGGVNSNAADQPLLFQMTLSASLNDIKMTVLTNYNNIENANKTATIYKIYYFLQKLFLPEL